MFIACTEQRRTQSKKQLINKREPNEVDSNECFSKSGMAIQSCLGFFFYFSFLSLNLCFGNGMTAVSLKGTF